MSSGKEATGEDLWEIVNEMVNKDKPPAMEEEAEKEDEACESSLSKGSDLVRRIGQLLAIPLMTGYLSRKHRWRFLPRTLDLPLDLHQLVVSVREMLSVQTSLPQTACRQRNSCGQEPSQRHQGCSLVTSPTQTYFFPETAYHFPCTLLTAYHC